MGHGDGLEKPQDEQLFVVPPPSFTVSGFGRTRDASSSQVELLRAALRGVRRVRAAPLQDRGRLLLLQVLRRRALQGTNCSPAAVL